MTGSGIHGHVLYLNSDGGFRNLFNLVGSLRQIKMEGGSR
jgi:hypothetical protein